MEKIEFTNSQKEYIVQKIKLYFERELNDEIGQFDAEFLLDFFAKEIGGHFYNRGLQDAQTEMESQMDSFKEAIYTMEHVTEV
jgi:uncharacterized protein (DUF2164 family)